MVTRRTAIGTGLAFASLACTVGGGAYGRTVRDRWPVQSIDALLIDESIEMPPHMASFIEASRWALPVIEVRLDAPGQARFKRLLDKSQALVGISCGATLFCLERIAWDYRFRLTGRSQRSASEPGDAAYRQEMAAWLSGTPPAAAGSSSLARPYRPSRRDDLLHSWVMHRAGPRPGQGQGHRDVSA
jgi:hypothetical protein